MPSTTPNVDGTPYRERLWPSPGVWLITVGLGLSSYVILLPVDARVAATAAVALAVALVTVVALTTPTVSLCGGTLRAGRAQMPVQQVRAAEPLTAQQLQTALRRELDARAYLCLRGWLTQGVRVDLADPSDPTPYWLISSRRPQQLAAAINQARQADERSA